MAKAKEPVKEDAVIEEKPEALTGSGEQRVKMRANSPVFGMRVGEERYFARSDLQAELAALNGHLTVVE